MADPFRSDRLIYRAVEPDHDEPFFLTIQQDPIAYANSNISLPKPQAKKDAKKYMKAVEEALLGVVICLPPPTPPPTSSTPSKPSNDDENKDRSEKDSIEPIPIGTIHLRAFPSNMLHHRFSEIGIDIIKPHQNQGYGSEAIRWILDYAFDVAGLHRVNIRGFTYNSSALRLYERLGFVKEGTSRESIWYDGQWWDDVQLGILDREWREIRSRKEATKLRAPDTRTN